jgi:peptidoglycan/LPS O-acetylase OafA/YrhL
VGRISYGLYLYHLPVQWALQRGLQESGWSPAFSTKLALLFGITYAVATVSWWCIERPALRLKRHF